MMAVVDNMKLAMVLLISVGSLLLADPALGQQLPCPLSARRPSDCCPCPDGSLVCVTCPPQHYNTSDTAVCLPTTTISPNTSQSPFTANTTVDNSSMPLSTSQLVRCVPCHVTCKSCVGARPEDCKVCANEHELQTVGSNMTCVRKNNGASGDNVGAIVGGSVAAVVVVVVVIAVVAVLLYWRRRQRNMEPKHHRSISTLMGSGVEVASSPSSSDRPESPAVSQEKGDGATGERQKAGKVHSHKDVYVNVQTAVPDTDSIQQGHNKVMRYTRDPTVKVERQKRKESKRSLEDEELANLPPAPAPPGSATAPRPPQDTYEIVEPQAAPPVRKPQSIPQATSSASGLAGCGRSYEIMDFPSSVASGQSGGPQTTKSGVTLLKTDPVGKEKRRTTTETSTSPSFLSPQISASCPALPKFRIEENKEKRSGHHTQHRLNRPSAAAHLPKKDLEKDYVNIVPEEKETQIAEQNISDPEDDYENTRPKTTVTPHTPDQSQGSEMVSPAMDGLDEPKDVYGNQDVMDDCHGPDHSSKPVMFNQASAEGEDLHQTDDRVMNGNDIGDDNDHIYQNVRYPKA